MVGSTTDVENLDNLDTKTLNRMGWYFLTYYKTIKDKDASSAYDKAVNRAIDHERKAGIRTVVKDDATYYEVWDMWK